ncbi:RNA polymerase sigma factor [Vulgatibacter sp.]|uniref:RNA polymerase sigma factor n=1 Tax=Vulgatibacter sp. TaxID=1971226 RepID=UPI0035689896
METAYRRFFPIIREKCARMLGDGDEAQDVAQETFVRLWKSAVAEEEPRQVTAWIYRTSTNLAVDLIRRRRFVVEAPVDREPGASLEGLVQARQELARIAGGVPADELAIAILHRIDGLGQEEVAKVADVSDRTVRRVLKRFDERLALLRAEAAS